MKNEDVLLPPPGTSVFLVGIGGIGMSGLAQLLRWQGYSVSGSDRGLEEPGKAELYEALKSRGIRLFPQDGSGIAAESPECLIVSSAVEEDNPDLLAAGNIPVLHRARALSQALSRIPAKMIAVAGSCGKTTVTGWIASALHALGKSVLTVNGGYFSGCAAGWEPGNFYADENPEWIVVEVDESDKSLVEFKPDYGLLLNVGTDHYSKDELERVFTRFLGGCRRGAVLPAELFSLAEGISVPYRLFSGDCIGDNAILHPENYSSGPEVTAFDAVCGTEYLGTVKTSQSGRHSSVNGAAVIALLGMLELPENYAELCRSLSAFRGIRQRFEIMGRTEDGTVLVNDYAHNPEKLSAALSTARERFGSPLFAVFQPHGFKPLAVMREELVRILPQVLAKEDVFVMLPVFYAGGTASFSPTSSEVVADLRAAGVQALALDRAETAEKMMSFSEKSCVIVMGARDSSLRGWTMELGGASTAL